MTKIYFIKDRTDANFRKSYMSLHKSLSGVQSRVKSLQSKLKDNLKHLVSYESIDVSDFDENKNSIYLVYDKTDKNHQSPLVDACFDYKNAVNKLVTRKAKVSPYAQKLIYLENVNLVN